MAQFCPECGSKLVVETAKFCPECGSPIAGTAPSASAAAAVEGDVARDVLMAARDVHVHSGDMKDCQVCAGTGTETYQKDCDYCAGTGMYNRNGNWSNPGTPGQTDPPGAHIMPCPSCGGQPLDFDQVFGLLSYNDILKRVKLQEITQSDIRGIVGDHDGIPGDYPRHNFYGRALNANYDLTRMGAIIHTELETTGWLDRFRAIQKEGKANNAAWQKESNKKEGLFVKINTLPFQERNRELEQSAMTLLEQARAHVERRRLEIEGEFWKQVISTLAKGTGKVSATRRCTGCNGQGKVRV